MVSKIATGVRVHARSKADETRPLCGAKGSAALRLTDRPREVTCRICRWWLTPRGPR